MSIESKRTLSVEDESVRAIRNRLWSAKTRIETAMQFVSRPHRFAQPSVRLRRTKPRRPSSSSKASAGW